MPTMSQLKRRAGAVLAKATDDQDRINRVRAEIVDLQLEASDIFPEGWPAFGRGSAHEAGRAIAKYADGPGRTWTGLGRKPTWLHEALDAGAELDDFLVADRKPARPKPRQGKEAPVEDKVVVYRCPDGTEWHGRGRRPQVLVNALKGGASLEDFATWRSAAKAKK